MINSFIKVSVGVPVFNGEQTIGTALEFLLKQTHSNLEIFISDNCSFDSTGKICEQFAARDRRIKYVRQPANISMARNFRYVLDACDSEYFFWNAADDVRSENFIEINLDFLLKNPDYVASTCPVRYENGEFDPIKMGDASLNGDSEERFIRFFDCWHANGRFYSLYRTTQIKKAISEAQYLGVDWATVLSMAKDSKFNRVESGHVLLGASGLSRGWKIYDAYRTRWYQWIVPFSELNSYVYRNTREFSLATRSTLFGRLLELNILATIYQYKYSRKQKNPDYDMRSLGTRLCSLGARMRSLGPRVGERLGIFYRRRKKRIKKFFNKHA